MPVRGPHRKHTTASRSATVEAAEEDGRGRAMRFPPERELAARLARLVLMVVAVTAAAVAALAVAHERAWAMGAGVAGAVALGAVLAVTLVAMAAYDTAGRELPPRRRRRGR